MTYSAIQSIISSLVQSGQVARFHPDYLDPDESEWREIILIQSVNKWIYEKDSRRSIYYKQNVRMHLSKFVLGDFIDNGNYMKSWKDDIWEIRVQLERREDNTRIFGGFLFPNIFVATNHHLRSQFKNEDLWNKAINRAVARWRLLFPGMDRLKCQPFRDCVTFNAYDYILREKIP